MDKSYRIHTNISSDTVLNVNMKQDFEFLEVLSLKLAQKDAYKLHSSNYGVIIGRVLANDAFGIPNAKISVFIERDTNDTTEIENIYPYTQVTTKDRNNIRYNLLPDYSDDECYRIVGTFPNKRLLLDDDTYLEVYDKYWKYTTVTNNAGDYMIFGVPSGSQQLHVDIDLSDIGILSQKPRDFIYKGYNITEFDNANQFKQSTNLDNLRQIVSQNKSVFVYPFWGDIDNGIAAITRADIQIDYKFEPTCIFMGSIVSDNEGNSIGHKCEPSVDNGMNDQLVAGEGTIEMIRRTVDGLVEEYQIQGNRLIDSDGVWCYQIPMNLDYVGTDEYGNIVPTDNPNKGIPTRTQVRFRISKTETGEEGTSRHTAKYLVPMNPPLMEGENDTIPRSALNGQDFEKLYNFGSNTPQSCFRDLYWNNVYSVKNYIPKVQVAHRAVSKNYGALKGSNLATDQNPIPFNKLRIDIPFMYMIVCILFMIILYIISFINEGVICVINSIINIFYRIKNVKIVGIKPFGWIPVPGFIGCISLGAGLSEDNIAYYPGCTCSHGLDAADCPEDMESNCRKVSDNTTLKDKIQQNLAQEYKIVKLDLYQDWINGCLYMPLWAWRKTKKQTFLFGLFSRSAKNEFCDCDRKYSRLKTYVTCDVQYADKSLRVLPAEDNGNEDRYHKQRRSWVRYENGLIKGVKNKDGLTAYYYAAMQPTNDNDDDVITNRDSGFAVARLYATDIILLGNINENNLYGIPQFFKVVPSTTANIPPIATVEEALNEEETKDESSSSDIGGGEDSGTTIITGMDWGARGSKQTPTYKTGLFLDLACTYAATRLKSCINVERLSELGVNLDMSYNMSYSNGGSGIQRGVIDSDGFITKYELDDMDNRSAFATLNHIGFVPQAYQDSVSGYTTQIEDENTSYLVPKFKFIYPTDFDGRLQGSMTRYRKGFEQAMFDESDEAYLTFRLGAENTDDNNHNGHYFGRTRHFYHHEDNVYRMPLYNNSFYFYFGINKGNTAIDKFNNLFLADCVQNEKDPFTLDIETRGKSYCECVYSGDTIRNAYGFIRVSSDDIQTPYAYTLYDSIGEVVVGEKNMAATAFTIGDITDKGKVKYQIPKDGVYETVDNSYGVSGLTNQVYNLVVKDNNGKEVSRKIELETPSLSFNYESFKLGTKFYDVETSSMDYICNEDDDYYGRIVLSDFAVDGVVCDLNGYTVEPVITSEGYIVHVDLVNNDKGIVSSGTSSCSTETYLTIGTLESDTIGGINGCLCESGETMMPRIYITNGNLQIDVYQPKRYIISMYQQCEGRVVNENSYSENIQVQNGENFNTFLNGMPTEFMLGTNSDTPTATIANTSKFYYTSPATSATDSHICGWFGVHQEDSYQFGRSNLVTVEKNQIVWEDFLDFGENGITAPSSKLAILKFKFESMFSLSNAVYSSGEFYYRAVGGVQPTLYRSVTPVYGNSNKRDRYVLDDINMVTVPSSYPNIVGGNYMFLDPDDDYDPVLPSNKTIPTFNRYYEDYSGNDCRYIGNYFGAFTNNGGYRNTKELDRTMSVMRSPNYASVSPDDSSSPKQIGKTIEGKINDDFEYAMKRGRQSLNGDKPRDVNPYLRALTVDRRLGYDLTVLGPVIGNMFPLYTPNLDTGNTIDYDRPWKGARIIGQIYGGIEMSYDRDYNIISANTQYDASGNVISASANGRLEYSYQFSSSDENANTTYNKGSVDSVWESDNDQASQSKMIIKRFYDANLGGVDIRNYFWSNFNKKRLKNYLTTQGVGYNALVSTSLPYIFSYPSGNTSFYNGDFNRDDAIKANNYPTKRFIDVCNIVSSNRYNLSISSCSYGGTQIILNEDGTLSSEVREGDGIELEFEFEKPIQFVEPSSGNKNFGNVVYNRIGNTSNGYSVFKAEDAYIVFTITKKSSSDFDVYTALPSMIRVLPYMKVNGKEIDGITYFKTTTENGEIVAKKSIDNAIENVSIYDWFGRLGVGLFNTASDMVAPDGVVADDELYINGKRLKERFLCYRKNWEYITSDSNDFGNVRFLRKVSLNNVKVFAIVIKRYYTDNGSTTLANTLRTIETSELIDCRNIWLKFAVGDTSNPLSYVELKNLQSDIDVETQGSSSEEEDEPTSETTTQEGKTKLYSQTVAFEMKIDTQAAPSSTDACNQVFVDYNNMSFTFMFKHNDDEYFVDCGNVSATENKQGDVTTSVMLLFSMKLPQEMGLLYDDTRGINKWDCALLAKTSSGFSYKVDFKISVSSQRLPQEQGVRELTQGTITG